MAQETRAALAQKMSSVDRENALRTLADLDKELNKLLAKQARHLRSHTFAQSLTLFRKFNTAKAPDADGA